MVGLAVFMHLYECS